MKTRRQSIESGKFVRILFAVSFIWFAAGLYLNSKDSSQIIAFIQIFLFSFLDLIFLLLLFWELFFEKNPKNTQRVNKIKVLFYAFFKLVCLVFLAITLKRLRNAPFAVHLMGISIVWVGPLISGIVMKSISKRNFN